MGQKYCPECKEVEVTKALSNYLQVEYRGILAKRRKIGHLEKDGGCGCTWFTFEMPEDVLIELGSR
jgi:hypothetical protein